MTVNTIWITHVFVSYWFLRKSAISKFLYLQQNSLQVIRIFISHNLFKQVFYTKQQQCFNIMYHENMQHSYKIGYLTTIFIFISWKPLYFQLETNFFQQVRCIYIQPTSSFYWVNSSILALIFEHNITSQEYWYHLTCWKPLLIGLEKSNEKSLIISQ